jgi:hypothetical protein
MKIIGLKVEKKFHIFFVQTGAFNISTTACYRYQKVKTLALYKVALKNDCIAFRGALTTSARIA